MHGPFYKRKIDIVLKAYLSLLLVSYFLNVLASDSSPFGCLSLVFLAHSACPPPSIVFVWWSTYFFLSSLSLSVLLVRTCLTTCKLSTVIDHHLLLGAVLWLVVFANHFVILFFNMKPSLSHVSFFCHHLH